MKTLGFITATVAVAFLPSCKSVHGDVLVGGFSKAEKPSTEEMALFRSVIGGQYKDYIVPRKVTHQVVVGTNYRFDCKDSFGNKVEIVVFQPLPGNGDPRVLSVNGENVEPEGFRYIIYYDGEETKQHLLEMASSRCDEVIYQYDNFKAIAIKITSCSTKERAYDAYSEQTGVIQMVEDGVVNIEGGEPAEKHPE